jgi:hypothetical protein
VLLKAALPDNFLKSASYDVKIHYAELVKSARNTLEIGNLLDHFLTQRIFLCDFVRSGFGLTSGVAEAK